MRSSSRQRWLTQRTIGLCCARTWKCLCEAVAVTTLVHHHCLLIMMLNVGVISHDRVLGHKRGHSGQIL